VTKVVTGAVHNPPLWLDAAWYTAAKLASGLGSLLLVAWLAHALSPADYALQSLAIAGATALSQWGCGWIYHGVMRFGGQGTGLTQAFPSVLRAAALSMLACAPVALVLWWWAGLSRLMAPALVMAFGLAWASVLLGAWQVQLQARQVAQYELARIGGMLAVCAALVFVPWPAATPLVLLLLWGYALAQAATALYFSGSRWSRPAISPAAANSAPTQHPANVGSGYPPAANLPASPNYRQWLRYGGPLAAWMGLFAMLAFLERSALLHLQSPAVAGQYASVCDVVVRGYALLLFPLTLATHGRAVQAQDAGGSRAAAPLLLRSLGWQLVACALSLPVLYWLGPWLVQRLLSQSVSGDLLVVIGLGAGLWQLALLVQKPLELAQRTALMACLMLLALLLEAALLWVLVPQHGVWAVAWANAGVALAYIAACGAAGWRSTVVVAEAKPL
jgi:O-antigen/teichoic acid export membrane protein